MPVIEATPLKFSSADGKKWIRMMYGQEAQAAWFIDHGEGFTMYAGTLTARFGTPRPQSDLQCALTKSWIKARHLSPLIASTQVKRDGQYWYEYDVPTSSELAEWLSKTIHWHDAPMTLLETDLMMENIWWKCSDGHHLVELHVVPSSENPGDLHLTYLAPHNGIDARSLMKIMENILTWTLQELKSPSAGDPTLDWGAEVIRLPPTLIVAAELPLQAAPEAKFTPAPPAGFIPFFPAIVDNDSASSSHYNNINVRLTLTETETANFRQACRKNKVTVTNLWLALLALAEIEYNLQVSTQSPEDVAQKTVTAYDAATHFLFGFYFMNHRHKFPGAYKTLEDGALLFGTEGTNLLFDMATMRKAVGFDKASQKVIRDTSHSTLWGGVVQMSKAVADGTPSDFGAVFQREVDRQLVLDAGKHDDTIFHMRVPMLSSIGDFTTMDILNPFVPGTGELSHEISILQLCHSIRVTHPLLVPICWTYAGRLDMVWSTGRKWQKQENLDLYKRIFKEWLDSAIEG